MRDAASTLDSLTPRELTPSPKDESNAANHGPGSGRGESSLPAYLGQIGRSTLLTPEQERELATRFRRAVSALRRIALELDRCDDSEIHP